MEGPDTTTSTSTSTGHANSPGRGYQKCGRKKCLACQAISHVDHQYFSSSATGKKYLLPEEELNCQSSNLIYLVTCSACSMQYVGRCETSLKVRHHKHRTQLRHKTEGIGRHFDKCGGYENFHISVIENVKKPHSIKDREVWWTKELETMHPLGMNLRDEGASGTKSKKKKGLKRL